MMPSWWHDLSWVLPFRSEALTPIFIGLSAIGTLLGYILLILAFAWTWQAAFINRFLPWIGVSAISNSWLKLYFEDPRPDPQWWVPGYHAGGYGLPSGHAQIAILFWATIAYALYQYQGWRWRLLFPLTLALLIGFSRNYLGVHDVEDVIIGSLVGLTLFLFFLGFDVRQVELKPITVLIIFFAIVAAAYASWPRGNPLEVLAPALALVTGWYGTRLLLPQPQVLAGSWPRRLLLAVAGLAVLMIFYAGISRILYDWQAQTVLLFVVGVLGVTWPHVTQRFSLR
jgi:membrane-associated phospholipid phosphatase